MRIAILSCFYPYRGGISQFGACMYLGLAEGNEVRAFNFSRQYPSVLFPGTTQFVSPEDDSTMVPSTRTLDSMNPFSWGATARKILQWEPDVVYICWWMSFFGPSMGRVAHYLRRRGVKVVGILHNVIPHEPHFWDKPLTKYFLSGCDGYVTLGEEGAVSLASLLGPEAGARSIRLFHPVYNQFGDRLPREKAERLLGLRPGCKNLLFFGLIRKYKGLDLLIEAFGKLPEDYQLIIAGEPYGDFTEYQDLIYESPGRDRIHSFIGYVPDVDVKNFFSAADLSVLPYRSATQSGVVAVSYNFDVPVVATDTGSLRYDVANRGTGLVADEATPEAIAETVRSCFDVPGRMEGFHKAIDKELKRLSWDNFCKLLLEFTGKL